MEDLKICCFAVTRVVFFSRTSSWSEKSWDGKDSINPYFHTGNLNFEGILNWVLQILLYHCSKQLKNVKNFEHYWTKYCYLSQSFPLFTVAWASIFLNARYFSVLGQSTLRNFKRHKWSFVPLHKKCVYNNFFRRFVSSVIESLQIFLK